MEKIDPSVPAVVAIAFSIQCGIDESKGISFTSCVPADCSAEELNDALDKIVTAANRQQAKVQLPKMLADLKDLENRHQNAAEDMFRLAAEADAANETWKQKHNGAGKRGDFIMTPAQRNDHQKREADKTNAEVTYKRMQAAIDLRKEEIANLKGLTSAVSSTTASNASLRNG